MPERSTVIRDAARESVLQFVDVVERVPPRAWKKRGLGEWTVRALVAHVAQGVESPVVYSGQPKAVDMHGAATYYLRAMSAPGIHEQVAERARWSTAMLGEEPAEASRTIAERTLAAIEGLEDDAPVATPFGTVRLIDYLPTRILEVTVHMMDIAEAVGIQAEPPPSALNASPALLGETAVSQGDGAMLAMALTGRQTLPEGFNALG